MADAVACILITWAAFAFGPAAALVVGLLTVLDWVERTVTARGREQKRVQNLRWERRVREMQDKWSGER